MTAQFLREKSSEGHFATAMISLIAAMAASCSPARANRPLACTLTDIGRWLVGASYEHPARVEIELTLVIGGVELVRQLMHTVTRVQSLVYDEPN